MTVQVVSQEERDLAQIVRMLRQLAEGRNNATGSFGCGTNVASTLVTAVNCAPSATVTITPVTTAAAAEIGNGTVYVSSVIAGMFWVTHASTSSVRTFLYATIG